MPNMVTLKNKEDPNVNVNTGRRVGKEAIHLNLNRWYLLISLPLVRFYRRLFTNVNLLESC